MTKPPVVYTLFDIYCKYTMDYSFHEGTTVLVNSNSECATASINSPRLPGF